jgi:3-oxoacyl-[acyl-carrier protein] reductase
MLPLHLTSETAWHGPLAVNATSAFHLLKWFVVQATKARMPTIAVSSSSVAAGAGFANEAAIAASNCAVTGPALSATATYADEGVRVNVAAPGLTRSRPTRQSSTPA